MADTRTLILEIVSDVSQATRGIQEVDSKLAGFGRSAKRLAGGLAATFAIAEVGQFAGDSLALASSVEESSSKLDILLGDLSSTSKAWAEQAFNIGLSEAAALEAAGTFANIGNTIGLSREESAAWSTELPQLAADLASFNNTSTEQAIEAIGAAMRGEAEPIRQLGVLLDAATLSSIAYANGIAETGAQLTPAQRAQAAYLAIMEQTTVAQGDAARTADGWANQQRRLSAQWANFQTQLGTAVLPLMEGLAGFVLDDVLPAMEDLGGFVAEQWPAAWETIGPVIEDIQELVLAFVNLTQAAWEEYGDEVAAVAGFVAGVVGDQMAAVIDVLRGVIDFLTAVFTGDWQGAWDAILDIADGLVDWFTALPSAIARELPGILSALAGFGVDMGKALVNAIIGAWNSLDLSIGPFTVPSWVPVFGGKSWSVSDLIPDVPTLHTGGVTTRGGLANLAPAEVVAPLDRLGALGRPVQIFVDATLSQDPVAVGAAVVEAVRAYETVAGPVLAVGSP